MHCSGTVAAACTLFSRRRHAFLQGVQDHGCSSHLLRVRRSGRQERACLERTGKQKWFNHLCTHLKNSSVQRLWCSAVADQRLAEPLRLTHHPSVILKHLVVCFFAIGMHACTSKLFLMIWQPFLSAHQAADFQGVQLEDGMLLSHTHPISNHTRARITKFAHRYPGRYQQDGRDRLRRAGGVQLRQLCYSERHQCRG